LHSLDPPRRKVIGGAIAGIFLPVASAAAQTASTAPVQAARRRGISPRDFGAAGDGSRDDAPAVQAAIEACQRGPVPTPLKVDGFFRLDRTVNIDRPTGRVGPRFNIIGTDEGAAFHVTRDVQMFSTSLPFRNDPISEGIAFRNIVFSADRPDRQAQCFGGGLFRMTFDNCDWYNIRCLHSTIYAQSWRFSSCRAYEWQGIFFKSAGSYDIVMQLETKFGDTIVESVSNTWPTMRMRVHDSIIEGIRGAAVRCGRASGLIFDGNYCEFNGAATLDLTLHPDGNTAVSVQGNTFVQRDEALADERFYDIRWGRTLRGVSGGNYCNGRLHDTSGMTGPDTLLTLTGDVAAIELFTGHPAAPNVPRRPRGNVQFTADGRAALTVDDAVFAAEPGLGGFSVAQGAAAPRRLVFGPVSPGEDNGRYGNVSWGAGSRIFNEAPSRGQPKGWICVTGGTPGHWVAEDLL